MPKFKLEFHLSYVYDANPEHYDTDNVEEMIQIDNSSLENDPSLFILEPFFEYQDPKNIVFPKENLKVNYTITQVE